MLAKKKKLSKKQIKEDSLVKSYYTALKFYEKHQSKILMGLGAVAVIIVVVVLYTSKITEDNRLANTQLSRVMSLYNSGSYLEAIEGRPGTNLNGLKEIVDKYGSTEQGQHAKVILANSYYFMKDFNSALEYYEDYSGENLLYKAAAYAGMANCYKELDNTEDAAEYYKKAASMSATNPLTPEYLLKASKCFIEIGQKDDAKILLTKIKDEYQTSAAAKDVDRYMAQTK